MLHYTTASMLLVWCWYGSQEFYKILKILKSVVVFSFFFHIAILPPVPRVEKQQHINPPHPEVRFLLGEPARHLFLGEVNVGVERVSPGEDHPHHHPQSPHVHLFVHGLASQYLGGTGAKPTNETRRKGRGKRRCDLWYQVV